VKPYLKAHLQSDYLLNICNASRQGDVTSESIGFRIGESLSQTAG